MIKPREMTESEQLAAASYLAHKVDNTEQEIITYATLNMADNAIPSAVAIMHSFTVLLTSRMLYSALQGTEDDITKEQAEAIVKRYLSNFVSEVLEKVYGQR
jgi:hypothetical protein